MLTSLRTLIRLLITLILSASLLPAVTPAKKKHTKSGAAKRALTNAAFSVPGKTITAAPLAAAKRTASSIKVSRVKASGPWRAPTYADATAGDYVEGDDPVVRRAAVDALGKLNGAVVVMDPFTGRVLTIVNQKVALKNGFQPCSTIKIPVALAALSESIVDRTTLLRIYGGTTLSMTDAIARSNNAYFASLGEKLGFERVSYYARLFGLGEKAGLDIDGEQSGVLPPETPKSGMGMMTSFGDGILLTPLEYAALIGAVANGGTLYYLRYPKNQPGDGALIPQIKRRLDIADLIPEIKPGMMGAVEYGTARRAVFDPNGPMYGKTGTCTDYRTPTHLGWFGSFMEAGNQKVVVVVLLTGGGAVSGPAAAGVAGQVYRNLDAQNFFAQHFLTQPAGRPALAAAQ
ncbi:MAG TPA: penicillin-binding transpeptidase domain-containing protein [Bryobacteraceae bacterium]|nr:penicillin-binding transpeptidase domain-containing protein [Bryobacteraceae bacterium]